jgi:HK97 family phage prohead protease
MDENEIEVRNLSYVEGRIEMRADANGNKMITGEAIVYERESNPIYGYYVEIIKRGALDEAKMDRVVARTNHDDGVLLGTTWAETLRLTDSPSALRYEVDVPDTTAGRDTAVYMERGDIAGSSFAFTVAEDNWIDRSEDKMLPIREIVKIDRLFDVSPVINPAYPDATSALRNLESWQDAEKAKVAAATAEQERSDKIKAESATLLAIHNHKKIKS